jgi:hypothetical protein
MKLGIYTWTAEAEGTVATGLLKDHAGRTVAPKALLDSQEGKDE